MNSNFTTGPDSAFAETDLRTPNGIRTRAATLKGWCPRPLDDGGMELLTVEKALEIYHLQLVKNLVTR